MARFRSILGRATDDDEQPIGLEIPETTCKKRKESVSRSNHKARSRDPKTILQIGAFHRASPVDLQKEPG
jgi:hypothetical protein